LVLKLHVAQLASHFRRRRRQMLEMVAKKSRAAAQVTLTDDAGERWVSTHFGCHEAVDEPRPRLTPEKLTLLYDW